MSKFIYEGTSIARIVSKIIFSTALFALTLFGQVKPETDARPLTVGQSIERELKSDEAHSYTLALQAGQFLSIVVEQKGIDVVVTLFDSDNKKVSEIDSPNGTQGAESLSAVIEKAGSYRLEIRSPDKTALVGRYEVKMAKSRAATEQDKKLIAARQRFAEAEAMRNEQKKESFLNAIKKYEESLSLYRAAADRPGEADALNKLAQVYQALSDSRKALEVLIEVLPIRRSLADKKGEAVTLNDIALSYSNLGENQKSLDYYNQSLLLLENFEDKSGAASVLSNIAQVYANTGDNQKAIEYNLKSLPLRRSSGDKKGEAVTLNNIGLIYYNLGENQKALDFFAEALSIARTVDYKAVEFSILGNTGLVYNRLGDTQKAVEQFLQILSLRQALGDKSGEASTLNNIGFLYRNLGENEKALKYFEQALLLRRAISDKNGEAATLLGMGTLYGNISENQKALDYFNQALTLHRAVGSKSGESLTLNNIGGVYLKLADLEKAANFYGQALALAKATGNKNTEAIAFANLASVAGRENNPQKALEFYNEALLLLKAVGDKDGEGTTLQNIGKTYMDLGDKQKALEYLLLAVPMLKAVGNKRLEALSLNNIAFVYSEMGERQKAVDYYATVLALRRAVGDIDGEALTLNNLMDIWNDSQNPGFAILLGKSSVIKRQQQRLKINGLDKNLQQSFLRSIDFTYRNLAEYLIKEKRLAEAQQILDLYKNQQYFDFGADKTIKPLALTASEAEFISEMDKNLDGIAAVSKKKDERQRVIGKRKPSKTEEAEIKNLEEDYQKAAADFLVFLEAAQNKFNASSSNKDILTSTADLQLLKTILRKTSASVKQNTTIVYTLIGKENFHALLITSDGIKSVSTPIKNTVLNEKAKQLWALLQSDKYDTTKLSKEIYDVVFKPLEKELPKDTRTIMWSMDGNLRYVPMAALFDGERFLVERYENVVFTRAEQERMTRPVSKIWTGTGFGSTKAQTVKLLGDNISFNALPGVTEELREIFKAQSAKSGILDGEVLPDEKFNQAAMLAALRQKRPLVHIASHFSFQPGDEARSFLLLGDGTAYTLEEMKKQTDLFAGVELLTLSACNTAAQQADANGREIDGFAELAQRLGAGAVMATLWSVADNSTPWLMRDFYANRQDGKNGVTKAEALRQAQKALLKGAAKTKPLPAGEKGAMANKLEIVITPNGEKTRDDTAQKRTSVVYLKQTDAPLYKKDAKRPFAHPFYWSPFVLIGNWR